MTSSESARLLKWFDEKFLVGSVWLHPAFYFQYTGETKPKFFVVLNPSAADGFAYIALTTSQTAAYSKNRLAMSQYVLIPQGRVGCFVFPTLVKVTNFQRLPFEVLRDNFPKRSIRDRMEFKEFLPNVLIEQIRNKFLFSDNIPQATKEMVFPT